MNDDDVFSDLIGQWVEHVSFRYGSGTMILITEDHFDDMEMSEYFRVVFEGVSLVEWDRLGTEFTPVSDYVAVLGQLEHAERDTDTWTLTGGFGEMRVSADDVHREDFRHDDSPSRAQIPAVEPPHACPAMVGALDDDDDGLRYSAKFREYGYRYTVGDSSVHVITFCPFCGTELPPDLRHEYFRRLDALGLDDEFDANLPPAMTSDQWWRELDLDRERPVPTRGSARVLWFE